MDIKYQDLIAERNLLSILLNNPQLTIDVGGILFDRDFTQVSHRFIFSAIQSLAEDSAINSSIDAAAIRTRAIKLGCSDFDKLTADGKYIDSLLHHKVNIENLKELVSRIRGLFVKRSFETVFDNLLHSLDEQRSSLELVGEVEKKIQESIKLLHNENEISILGEGFEEWVDEQAENPKNFVGVSTGILKYDEAIGGGLRRGSVSLIAARPKCFKSGTALNIAVNMSLRGIPVLILDTELDRDYQRARLGACVSGVPIDDLETGQWLKNPKMKDRVKESISKIEKLPLSHVYVGGFPIEKTLSMMRYWLTHFVGRNERGEFNDCAVIYDYIKLMSSREMKDVTEWQKLGFYMMDLHDFTQRHKIPMLTFSQLNRMGDIASSDRLSWFVSNSSVLEYKSWDEMERDGRDAGNMKLTTMMTRYGPGMKNRDFLNLNVEFEKMKLMEGSLSSELNNEDSIF